MQILTSSEIYLISGGNRNNHSIMDNIARDTISGSVVGASIGFFVGSIATLAGISPDGLGFKGIMFTAGGIGAIVGAGVSLVNQAEKLLSK